MIMREYVRKFRIESVSVVRFILIMVLIGFSTICYSNDEKPFVPWDYNNSHQGVKNTISQEREPSLGGYLLIQAVKFYQNYISSVIGERCQMYPSCSAYSIEAIKKHGIFVGFVMTADRLLHEGDEMELATQIEQGERIKYYDPVSNNDFWWYKENDRFTPLSISK